MSRLENSEYPRPGGFINTSVQNLRQVLDDVIGDIRISTRRINGRNKKVNPSQYYRTQTDLLKLHKVTLEKYKNTLNDYLTLINYLRTGSGIFHFNNPRQHIYRIKLLGGSIMAVNNEKRNNN